MELEGGVGDQIDELPVAELEGLRSVLLLGAGVRGLDQVTNRGRRLEADADAGSGPDAKFLRRCVRRPNVSYGGENSRDALCVRTLQYSRFRLLES